MIIGSERNSNLRYADDTLLIAKSEKELLVLLDRLKNLSQEYGLRLNNTKIIIVDRKHNNFLDTSHIGGFKAVDEFASGRAS